MFQVSCSGGYPGRRTISSGVVFGKSGIPLDFSVQAAGASHPLNLKFCVIDDISKPSFYYELSEMFEGQVNLNFFNVALNGSSSSGDPVTIVSSRNVDLQMIFHVDRIQPAPNFRLTYEFFEVAS